MRRLSEVVWRTISGEHYAAFLPARTREVSRSNKRPISISKYSATRLSETSLFANIETVVPQSQGDWSSRHVRTCARLEGRSNGLAGRHLVDNDRLSDPADEHELVKTYKVSMLNVVLEKASITVIADQWSSARLKKCTNTPSKVDVGVMVMKKATP